MKLLRRLALAWVLVLVIGIVGELGFFALRARELPPPALLPVHPTQVRGAYHVHSKLSDGRGTPEEIARAASHAGLSFVVLTDHNLTELPPPRWVDGVLLIFETEQSTPWGHVVALDLDHGLSSAERDADPIATIEAQHGAALIAHPVQIKCPWTDWAAAKRADGMELYSGDSFFREALADPARILLPAAGTYWVRPAWGLWMLARASQPTRERLVEMSAGRRVSALCAHDAHGIPSYENAFSALSVYLDSIPQLPEDPVAARHQVTGALRHGEFHCGFGDWASADGFSLGGDLKQDREAWVGSTLEVRIPSSPPGHIRVEVHGDATATLSPDQRQLRLTRAGLLWVEVWVQPGSKTGATWLPWIVSSPVRVVERS